MSGPSTPSWYDVLDVERGAGDAEVRAAWKAAIADLDPTDRRFGVLTQAAEVLLDPRRRASYDAELAAADRERAAEEVPAGPPPSATDGSTGDAAGPVRHPAPDDAPRRVAVPAWLLAALAVATLIVLGACAWVVVEKPTDASIEASTRAARSAAERAVVPVLSYDAAHLDEDQQAAESYLTSDYRSDYDKLFALIKDNAPRTGTVVTARVIDSAVVRAGEDRVQVLLFVNRPTTNKQTSEPIVYHDQVTLTMQRVDGEWLVDDLVTSPVGP